MSYTGALEIVDVLPQDVGSYRCNASGFDQFRLSNKAQLTLQTSDIGKYFQVYQISMLLLLLYNYYSNKIFFIIINTLASF